MKPGNIFLLRQHDIGIFKNLSDGLYSPGPEIAEIGIRSGKDVIYISDGQEGKFLVKRNMSYQTDISLSGFQ